ncbi:MAG: LamG domain-containing protein, partial [Luteolibacter sp.]
VSSGYASFDGGSAAFGANMGSVPVDNFAVEMWVRVANDAQSVGIFSMGRRADGNLRFHVENGYWAASYKGVGWIGSDPINSPAASQAITENLWTHLAVIRSSGVSTFYVDGIAQAGTSTATPVHETSRAHIGVFNQSLAYYAGDVDDLRVFTFDPISDSPVASLSISAIPEPSSVVPIGCIILTVAMRRRR